MPVIFFADWFIEEQLKIADIMTAFNVQFTTPSCTHNGIRALYYVYIVGCGAVFRILYNVILLVLECNDCAAPGMVFWYLTYQAYQNSRENVLYTNTTLQRVKFIATVEAETLLGHLQHSVRKKLKATTPERMIAMPWDELSLGRIATWTRTPPPGRIQTASCPHPNYAVWRGYFWAVKLRQRQICRIVRSVGFDVAYSLYQHHPLPW